MSDVVRLLDNEETSQLLDIQSCVEELEVAYTELGHGRAVTIGRRDVNAKVSSVDAILQFKCMGGVVPALDAAAIRTDCDLLRWPRFDDGPRQVKVTQAQDPKLRIGKENGLILVYRISTSELVAMMTDGHVQ